MKFPFSSRGSSEPEGELAADCVCCVVFDLFSIILLVYLIQLARASFCLRPLAQQKRYVPRPPANDSAPAVSRRGVALISTTRGIQCLPVSARSRAFVDGML